MTTTSISDQTTNPFSYEFENEAENMPNDSADASGIPWEPPVELSYHEQPLPAFDENLIPRAFRSWILDAAPRIGVPAEAILVPALAAAATVVGNTYRVQPKNQDDQWTEAPNQFAAIIGPSSSGKSPALKEGLRFIKSLQEDRDDQHAKVSKRLKAKGRLAEIRIKDIEAKLGKAESGAAISKLETEFAEALAQKEASASSGRRYIVNDATVEKLAMLLGESANRGGIMLFRDELAGLLDSMSRAGHENDRQFYLEGHNGTGSYNAFRVTRDAVRIRVFTLSMVGGMQPTVLGPLVSAARSGHGDDGLLPRFQLAVWIDDTTIGLNRSANKDALASAEAVFRSLQEAAIQRESTLRPGGYELVTFTDEAQEVIDTWWREVLSLANGPIGSDNPGFRSHLGKGRGMVSRIALLYFAIAQAQGATDGAISKEHALQAVKLMDFLHGHARRTYRTHVPSDLDALLELRAALVNGDAWDGMTMREIQRSKLKKFGKKADLLSLLRRAEELGWLRLKTAAAKGKPSSTIIEINPLLT